MKPWVELLMHTHKPISNLVRFASYLDTKSLAPVGVKIMNRIIKADGAEASHLKQLSTLLRCMERHR